MLVPKCSLAVCTSLLERGRVSVVAGAMSARPDFVGGAGAFARILHGRGGSLGFQAAAGSVGVCLWVPACGPGLFCDARPSGVAVRVVRLIVFVDSNQEHQGQAWLGSRLVRAFCRG